MKILWLQTEGQITQDWEKLTSDGKIKRVRVRRRKLVCARYDFVY
jgi:hypothetical protein